MISLLSIELCSANEYKIGSIIDISAVLDVISVVNVTIKAILISNNIVESVVKFKSLIAICQLIQ